MTAASTPDLVLNEIDASARGPTDYSHWVIPKRLLGSAYPASREQDSQTWMTDQIIVKSSIDVVVNLMEAKELSAFAPYRDIMTQYAYQVNRVLDFLSFPIPDNNVNPDAQKVLEFCLELCQRIRRGQVLLVHCWGGHGRTGTIVSIIIGILFNMKGDKAMSINSALHDQRIQTNGGLSPQTQIQFDQVRLILDKLYPEHMAKQA